MATGGEGIKDILVFKKLSLHNNDLKFKIQTILLMFVILLNKKIERPFT